MAIVIHNGKRYRFSMPYRGDRFDVVRYAPAPDSSGLLNEDDLLLFIGDNESKLTIECDGEDAAELDQSIEALKAGTLTTAHFEDVLIKFFSETLRAEEG